MEEVGTFPNSFNEANITLLPKPDKKGTEESQTTQQHHL